MIPRLRGSTDPDLQKCFCEKDGLPLSFLAVFACVNDVNVAQVCPRFTNNLLKSPGQELDTSWKYNEEHPPVALPVPARLNRKSAASNKSAPESGRSSRKLASPAAWPGHQSMRNAWHRSTAGSLEHPSADVVKLQLQPLWNADTDPQQTQKVCRVASKKLLVNNYDHGTSLFCGCSTGWTWGLPLQCWITWGWSFQRLLNESLCSLRVQDRKPIQSR